MLYMVYYRVTDDYGTDEWRRDSLRRYKRLKSAIQRAQQINSDVYIQQYQGPIVYYRLAGELNPTAA